jgi:hypothetical protein
MKTLSKVKEINKSDEKKFSQSFREFSNFVFLLSFFFVRSERATKSQIKEERRSG